MPWSFPGFSICWRFPIPELARCAAAGSQRRIRYLVKRSLKATLLYALVFSGLLYLLAVPLCQGLFRNAQAGALLQGYALLVPMLYCDAIIDAMTKGLGQQRSCVRYNILSSALDVEAGALLQGYALLVPMLYCDAIIDAMTKGLGQQRSCVRYNILSSALDVVLLYWLLPKYGMGGYFVSFLISHALNFLLSLRRLLTITRQCIPWQIPAISLVAALAAGFGGSQFASPVSRSAVYLALLGSLLCLCQILGQEDIRWLRGLAALAAGFGGSQFASPVSRSAVYLALLGSLLCLCQILGQEDIRWLRGLLAGSSRHK